MKCRQAFRSDSNVGDEVLQRPVVAKQRAVRAIAKADGAPYDCVEHWLQIGRRPRNGAQNLGSGRLLVERLVTFGFILSDLLLEGCNDFPELVYVVVGHQAGSQMQCSNS